MYLTPTRHALRTARTRRAGRISTAAAVATTVGVLAAAGSTAAASVTASVSADTLTVNGGSGADRIALRLAAGEPGTLQVDAGDDGTADFSFDRATFSRIHLLGGSGADELRIDQVNGAFADEQITMDGGSGDDVMNGGDGAERFLGSSGSDQADGNRGDDTGVMGSGNDTFRWDPGDGSDVVEGESGTDTLDFNGAGANENMSLTANGQRSLFLRDVANIRMDMDGVERLHLTALGGVDTMRVGDLTGTDVEEAIVDLSGLTGGGDGQADTVTVEGTLGADAIQATTDGSAVVVDGLTATTRVTGAELIDTLVLDGRGGNDAIDVDDAATALIGVQIP